MSVTATTPRGVWELAGLVARGGMPILLAIDRRGEAVELAIVHTREDYESEVKRMERRLESLDPEPTSPPVPSPRRKHHA